MPPTPQPSTPRPLTIVVCESVPTQVSGYATPCAVHDHARQVFDVDLVHDAGARRHHLEVVECALPPAQELVALPVALVLDLDVALECVGGAEQVGDHRVVDHQVGRRQRVDLVRVAAEVADGLAHGGQVDDAGHAGEVLHHDAGGRVLDLNAGLRLGIPVRDGLDVVLGDIAAVLVAQQVLGEDFEAVGEFLGIGDGVEAIDLVTLVADLEGVACSERVHRIFASHINSRGLSSSADGPCRRCGANFNSTLVLYYGGTRSSSLVASGAGLNPSPTTRATAPGHVGV